MTGKAILGISAYYHDSAAALVVDGQIIAAAQEERFTRKKHDAAFPRHSVRYVLEESGVPFENLSAVVFYEKPFLKFERLLETYHAFAPKGLQSFTKAVPVWLKEKLFLKKMLKDALSAFGKTEAPLLFTEHHLSHAASAFYPSPFKDAAIITIDGIGEWASATIGRGIGASIEILKELHFPHSPGLLYSAFTWYLGFRVNSGEYKLMGLAPYGHEGSPQTESFKKTIKETLVDIREDGSMALNMDYFRFATGLRMTDNRKWEALFGFPARKPETEIRQEHMDLALAIQQVTDEIVFKIAAHAKELTGCGNLCMAGGVALNCVANGKLSKSGLFRDIWIQPAAGDAGGAVGAALAGWHLFFQNDRVPVYPDSMKGSLLGPEFSDRDIERIITRFEAKATFYAGKDELCKEVASLIDHANVVGWFQGRMEFGPRALGNRSILADARNPDMQKKLNLKIKYREGFRPFAPAVLKEDIPDWFELNHDSPYMLLIGSLKESRKKPEPAGYHGLSLQERLYHQRSDIPAVTHIDYSARIQSVAQDTNPLFYHLIREFKNRTGEGILVNTSFNVRGEPVVCTPDDAYLCFMATEMDYLAMGNYLFGKKDQPPLTRQTERSVYMD